MDMADYEASAANAGPRDDEKFRLDFMTQKGKVVIGIDRQSMTTLYWQIKELLKEDLA